MSSDVCPFFLFLEVFVKKIGIHLSLNLVEITTKAIWIWRVKITNSFFLLVIFQYKFSISLCSSSCNYVFLGICIFNQIYC